MTLRPSVCFLTGTLNAFAGAERVTATIASGLAARGYRVHVLSLWDRRSCFALHPAITHEALFDTRPSFKHSYLQTVRGIRQHITRHRIDVLVEVDTMLALFTLPATLGLPTRRVSWEHCNFDQDLGKPARFIYMFRVFRPTSPMNVGTWILSAASASSGLALIGGFARRLARRLAARFNANVIVLTERDKALWQVALPHARNVVAIPNPLPFDLPEMPAPRKQPTVLAVGRLTRAKGFDVLLQAWGQVSQAHPGWRLEIVGEGEERAGLEKLRADLGLSQSVSLPGARVDIDAAYRVASVFCLSSRYEGFGLVLLEAMAFGLPIVSTACETGPKALLEDGIQAVMVPPDAPRDLARALVRVMGNPQLQQALGTAGRNTAACYSLDHIVRQWEMLLSMLPGKTASNKVT